MERCLWAIGLLALAAWFGVWFNARQQQAEGNRELDRRLEAPRETRRGMGAPRTPSFSPRARLPEGELIGRIEIPRLHVSTIVFEGTGDKVLSIGVGHLSGTALPGEQGNVVLAAHRDTFFRPLRNIHNLDTIDIVTPSGTRRYSVDSTAIVRPDHTEVLGPTTGAVLTLVTCYPFDWFGHAPQRFIVRAHELRGTTPSVEPAPAIRTQTPAEESEVMASVEHPPGVHPQRVHLTRSAMRTVVPSRPEPVGRQTDPIPLAPEIAPVPVDEPALPVNETAPAQERTAIQEVMADTPATPRGSRIVRGLKKLNPKRVLAKMAGQ